MASLKIDKLYKLCLDEFRPYLNIKGWYHCEDSYPIAYCRGNILRWTDPVLSINIHAIAVSKTIFLLFGDNQRNKLLLEDMKKNNYNIYIINSKRDFLKIKKIIEDYILAIEDLENELHKEKELLNIDSLPKGELKDIVTNITNEFSTLTKEDGTVYEI